MRARAILHLPDPGAAVEARYGTRPGFTRRLDVLQDWSRIPGTLEPDLRQLAQSLMDEIAGWAESRRRTQHSK